MYFCSITKGTTIATLPNSTTLRKNKEGASGNLCTPTKAGMNV